MVSKVREGRPEKSHEQAQWQGRIASVYAGVLHGLFAGCVDRVWDKGLGLRGVHNGLALQGLAAGHSFL